MRSSDGLGEDRVWSHAESAADMGQAVASAAAKAWSAMWVLRRRNRRGGAGYRRVAAFYVDSAVEAYARAACPETDIHDE
jgi:hypothetical protein